MNSENESVSAFQLAPALAREALARADLDLTTVLLRDEARFPWIVLVPRVAGARESFDLLPGDRAQLWEEINLVSAALQAATGASKMNVAAFGNMEPQLHIHVIARSVGDAAWPGSAVGHGERTPYEGGVIPAFWPSLLERLPLTARTKP